EYKTEGFSGDLVVDGTSDYAGITYNVSVNGDNGFEEALFPLVPLDSIVYVDLLEFMRDINNEGNNVVTVWDNLPIKVYHGDSPDPELEQARINAQANWENKTFNWKDQTVSAPDYFMDVDENPEIGMRISYDTRFCTGAVVWEGDFGGERGHAQDRTPRKAVIHINPSIVIGTLDAITTIYEHELHHILHDSASESKDSIHTSKPSFVHVSNDDAILTTTMYKLTDFYKPKNSFPDLRIYS
ncbi:hypothetical protein CL617_02520, partial [archaeon]|nr:hypothetical protein [archaeon]